MSEQAPAVKPTEAKAPEGKSTTPAKKRERKESPVYKFYEVKAGQANRLRKECPRCGKGVFLAEHVDRLTCGKCGYTSFKKQK